MITPFLSGVFSFIFFLQHLFEHSLHKIQSNYIYLLPYAYQAKNNNKNYIGKKEISKWFEKQE